MKNSAKAAASIILVIFYSYDSKYEGTKLHIFSQILLLIKKYLVLLHRIMR